MIDWLTFRAPLAQSRPLNGGSVISTRIDPRTLEETIEWESTKRLQVLGSHDSSIQIRSLPSDPRSFIEITGNPAKLFQGHNVFGSDDLHGLCIAMYLHVCETLGLVPTDSDAQRIIAGDFELSRVDVTYSWCLGNRQRVQSALRALEATATLTHRGRGTLLKGNTLYFGKTSRRWSLKLYGKAQELEVHRLPDALASGPLPQHAEGLLRGELTLRSLELKRRGLHLASCWQDNTPPEKHRSIMGRLNIAEATMLEPDTLQSLPARLVGAHQMWMDGHDLRAKFARPTFYRYRKELLAYGVDIATQQPARRVATNVVPLKIVLHAQPVGVPDWAIDTPLYYEPRRIA